MSLLLPETDERGRWTSASAAEYDLLCPGRHLAQRDIAEPLATPDAERGTRIHAALAEDTPDGSTLTGDDADVYDACKQRCHSIFTEWAVPDQPVNVWREQRLWMEFSRLGMWSLLHSGKPDVFYIQGDRALIVDYKTGRMEVAANPRNQQLRDLAVLLVRNFQQVMEVRVAIAQPFVPIQPPCDYTIQDIGTAAIELEARVVASNDPASPRIPSGTACQFCRAKATCPEFRNAVSSAVLPMVPIQADSAATRVALALGIRHMPGDRLGPFLSLIRLVLEVAEEEARARLDKGELVHGWHYQPGRTMNKIVDPQALFNRFIELGGSAGQFLPTVSVTKGRLKEAVREITGLKGKALDERIATLLDGLTEESKSQPMLVEGEGVPCNT